MAKTYRLTTAQRAANKVFGFFVERGVGADYRYLLSVRGRKTGKIRSTPVDVMQDGDRRWLVAPYGAVNWVRNLRAADGQLMLRRGRNVEHLAAQEIGAQDAIPVIRRYIRSVPVTRGYWDVTADSTDQAIAVESVNHPVFRLRQASPKPAAA